MKALTIWQPHASMLAIGLRRIETRSWSTRYRGPLLIHAAKRWDSGRAIECAKAIDASRSYRHALTIGQAAIADLSFGESLGCVLAIANLVDCIPIPEPTGTELDKMFGGFGAGRFGWVLEDTLVVHPTPMTGAQGLWEYKGPELIEID